MKPCSCKDQHQAIKQSSNRLPNEFGTHIRGQQPLPEEVQFLAENGGKFCCFTCGGSLPSGSTFPVPGWVFTTRLREIGVLTPPLSPEELLISQACTYATEVE